MATRVSTIGSSVRRGAMRSGAMLSAIAVGTLTVMLALALFSYTASDRALNTSADGVSGNLMGSVGAWIADLLLTSFGPASVLLVPLAIVAATRLWRGVSMEGAGGRVAGALIGIMLLGTALAIFRSDAYPGLPGGLGGVIGFAFAAVVTWLVGLIPGLETFKLLNWALVAVFGLMGVIVWARSLCLDADERAWLARRSSWWRLFRLPTMPWKKSAEAEPLVLAEPEALTEPAPRPLVSQEPRSRPIIAEPSPAAAARPAQPKQTSFDLKDRFVLPPLDLLVPAPPSTGPTLDKAALERNARLLETVLDDFKVKGQIVEVRA